MPNTDAMQQPQTELLPRMVRDLSLVVLLAACIAHGMLEVHSSNDTYIGLAAGRLILESPEFPLHDTFSHTVPENTVWVNQNWLTHVAQWWLYDTLGPNWVIYGTWLLVTLTVIFTLLACYWRAHTWVGAALVAAVVAYGLRDFVSARPATTGFFCFAAWWALICALEGQREKVRWWPIALLLPLLLIWSNAHGSFVLGYGLLAVYLGHWFVQRTVHQRYALAYSLGGGALAILVVALVAGFDIARTALLLGAFGAYWAAQRVWRPAPVLRDTQAYAIMGVTALAVTLVALFGPYGIENFTHVTKVAGSDLWRGVSEWRPPTEPASYPPVHRFWWIFGGALALLAIGLAVFTAPRQTPRDWRAELRRYHTSLFDVAVVVLAIVLTFWARRFAPLFFIFAGPLVLTWLRVLLWRLGERDLLRRIMPRPERWAPLATAAVALLGAVGASIVTFTHAHRDLVEIPRRVEALRADAGPSSLFERVVRYDASPDEAFRFLRENELTVRLFTEWTQGGIAMFHVPNVRVFKDGRAQQVYRERNYREYQDVARADSPTRVAELLDQYATDGILLRARRRTAALYRWVQEHPAWSVVLHRRNDYLLALRVDSPPFEALLRKLERGEAWYPEGPWPTLARARLRAAHRPPNLTAAAADLRTALAGDPETGIEAYRLLTQIALRLGDAEEAWSFLDREAARITQRNAGIPPELRTALLQQIVECRRMIQQARAADAPPTPGMPQP